MKQRKGEKVDISMVCRRGLADLNIPIRNIVRPVAGVHGVIVQQGEGALLDRRGSIPTMEIPWIF